MEKWNTLNFEKIFTFWVDAVSYQLFSNLFITICECVCVCVCVFVCAEIALLQ